MKKAIILEKFSNLLKLLKNFKIVPFCLLAYVTKTLIFSPSYAESIVIVALSALYGYFYLIESRRVPKPTEIMYEEMKVIKSQLASIKVNMGMKIKDINGEASKKRRF